MAANSGIQWTDSTFNGWWGCTRVGPGCDHCYAADLDKRTGGDHWGAGVERRLTSDRNWNEPIRWNRMAAEAGKPIKVFASSMCDVFDNEVPQAWRDRLWLLIEKTPWLRWQILTKRIGNAEKMLPERWREAWPSHVGVMATVVNQEEADRDIPKLVRLKREWGARWIGLSVEPMLGGTNIAPWLADVDWVIWGGESGPEARETHLEWGLFLVYQCKCAGVAFFAKQAGDRPMLDGMRLHALGPKGKVMSLWPEALRVREFPEALLS